MPCLHKKGCFLGAVPCCSLCLCPWEQHLVPASPGPFWAEGDTCREFPSASLPAAEQAPILKPRLAHPGLHLSEASLGSLLSGNPCEPQTSPNILVSSAKCQAEDNVSRSSSSRLSWRPKYLSGAKLSFLLSFRI